jgi:Fur family ferric uptake transcriptional regulator
VALKDEQAAGFQLLFHTLEFFGLCRACQERQSA